MFTEIMTEMSQLSQNNFYCKKCDYTTCKKNDYSKHILTSKHLNDDQKIPNVAKKRVCDCGKEYSCKQSLSIHKKKCSTQKININEKNIIIENDINLKELFKLQLNENKELKDMILEQSKLMMEICKEKTYNNNINNNNNTINSHNKSFNLNFFLNETCKDAMNMSEFIDSMKLQLSDLEYVGKLGFVDGISGIIIKNLEALEVEKRPIHCCDSKRETMYIKDQDKWEKDDNDLKRMKELIRTVRDRNISMISTWRDLYPECVKSNSNKTTQFNNICMESFGGEKGTKQEKEEKIISKIAKSVVIDKSE